MFIRAVHVGTHAAIMDRKQMPAAKLCVNTGKDGSVFRKKKVEDGLNVDLVSVFVKMVEKNRLLDTLQFLQSDSRQIWCHLEMLCPVQDVF